MALSPAVCGHLNIQSEGCQMLCDDYVGSEPGICYLLGFDMHERKEVLKELKKYPFISSFMTLYNSSKYDTIAVHITPPIFDSNVLHARIDSLSQQEPTVASVKFCGSCNFSQTSYLNSLKPKLTTHCEMCEAKGSCRVASTIRFRYYSHRIGSDLPLSNTIKSEPGATEYELRPQKLYLSESAVPQTESQVLVHGENVTLTIGTNTVTLNRSSQKLKSFVHDFVATKWKEDTDMKLSTLGVLGPEGLLTPDFILEGTRCVLELGTCNSGNVRSIQSMYEDKVVKYQGELELVKAKFFITIVSPQHVMTNTNISQSFVDELTQRMRLATPLREKIIEKLGEDIFDDEFSEQERTIKHVFRSIPPSKEIDGKYLFNLKELEHAESPMTEGEQTSAARILLRMYESTKTIHSSSKKDLDDYMGKFNPQNSRMDLKRVSNIPMILPGVDTGYMDISFEGNQSLKSIWSQNNSQHTLSPKVQTLLDILNNQEPDIRHMTKKSLLKKVHLDYEEKIEAALSGIGGKAFSKDPTKEDHQREAKKSFHPLAPTKDIEEFMKIDLLFSDGTPNLYLNPDLKTLVESTKEISCPEGDNLSLSIWNELMKTDVMKFSMMMSAIFFEMAYCYKHWTMNYEFIHKKLPGGVEMIMYNPKSTLFVSFAYPKIGCKAWDTGRLGPTMYSSKTHYFTDWASYDNSQLEHFIKFGPYMGSCIMELLSCSESSMTNYSRYARDCTNHILLLYCNNKVDTEELISSQRYFIMKVLEDVGSSPYIFVDRLPKVLRSRLTSYYLQRTIHLMEFYDTNKITKVPIQGKDMILYEYINVKSMFSSIHISLAMKINEFYFGYVVSKERNTGKDKTFKVLTKLLKQEQKFRRVVKGSMFTQGEDYEEFKTNMPLIKFFSKSFGDILEGKFGRDYKEKILSDFVHDTARTSFSDLATLKVSARDHSGDVELKLGGKDTEAIYQEISKMYPKEIYKRPFCMEAITAVIKSYESETGKLIKHVTQLAPWCLNKLLEKGYFDSDQFDKSQHTGEREIHVMEIMARIVQYFLETMSKTICSYFPSETITNPKTKDTFVRDHYTKAKQLFGDEHVTSSKSADATVWCQFHHSTHFAAMLVNILPKELKNFAVSVLSLWPRKRMSFPLKQAASLANNPRLTTDNKVFMQFKDEFHSGSGMFVGPRSNCVEIRSGMFQGLLHYTSSLYHVMIQEVMKQVILTACAGRFRMKDVIISICEGSDDSAQMITTKGKPSVAMFKRHKRLLLWKERVTPYLSVFCNEAKSSIGTHDLVEYNSEWNIRHMTVKPTFRWVSASQTVSVTERFIDRFRIYNNMITDCLSGGASTLQCSVIQLFQCTMHYMLMGMSTQLNQKVSQEYSIMIRQNPNPLHGFFPLDEDVSCGVPGVEFLLHRLYKTTSFGTLSRSLGESDVEVDYSPEDLPTWMKTKDLTSVRLKFSNMRIFYKVLERMNIEPLEVAIEAVEKDPDILFSKANDWKDEQHNLVLKVYSRGVKESISSRSSLLRMAAASSYILVNRCFTANGSEDHTKEIDKESIKEINRLKALLQDSSENLDNVKRAIKDLENPLDKCTLLSLMTEYSKKVSTAQKNSKYEPNLFPYHHEYMKIHSDIQNLKLKGVLSEQYTKRTSKAKIVVIEKPVGEIDMIEMCKRQWFQRGRVPFSRGQFKRKWEDLVNKFPFVSSNTGLDGFRETCKNLKMSAVQGKMFMESLSLRARSIVLYDSHSRGGSLIYNLSRIFWPNKKISVPDSDVQDKISQLKSTLFSISTFWFNKATKDNMVIKELKNSSILRERWTDLPSHGKRLKIFSEVIRKLPNEYLIDRIESSKRGLLGAYTQQQKGHGSNRKGVGVWQGSICGLSVIINMHNNTCTHISVNVLHDTVSLGVHLNNFLNDSSLVLPNSTEANKFKTNCWLNGEGRIIISREPKGVPIIQNSKLKTMHLDETVNMHWFVDINNQNLRIRARSQQTSELFTIMSETLTNSDWIPGLSTDTDDPIFRQWVQGDSVNLTNLESLLKLSFPKNRYDFFKAKGLDCRGTLYEDLGWDLKNMQVVLRDAIHYNGKLLEPKAEEDEAMTHKDVLNRFQQMLSSAIEEFDIGLDEEIENWADEVDMEEEKLEGMWGVDMTADEEKAIENMIDMFQGSNTEKFFELIDYQDLKKNFRMPSSSRFISSLEHYNMIVNRESLLKTASDQKSAEGLLGIILTIITGKYLVGRDDGLSSEVINIEDEINSISSSMSRPTHMNLLNIDEIRVQISNIEHQLEVERGTVSRRLRRLLSIYKDREEEILARTDPHTRDLVMINSQQIITEMINHFDNNDLIPIKLRSMDSEMAKSMFKAIVRTEVSRCNYLTNREKDETLLHLSTDSVSRGSLQSIGMAFDITIKVNEDFIYETSKVPSTNFFFSI